MALRGRIIRNGVVLLRHLVGTLAETRHIVRCEVGLLKLLILWSLKVVWIVVILGFGDITLARVSNEVVKRYALFHSLAQLIGSAVAHAIIEAAAI